MRLSPRSCSRLAHPTHFLSGGQIYSRVGLVTHLAYIPAVQTDGELREKVKLGRQMSEG